MSIQAEVNHSINVDRIRSITLKNQTGDLELPSDVTLNLIDCSIGKITLGARTTLNVTDGSITGNISSVKGGQCQLLLYNVKINSNVSINNSIVEFFKCEFSNSLTMSFDNGTRCKILGKKENSTLEIKVSDKSHLDIIDCPVTGYIEIEDNSSLFCSNSDLTSNSNKSLKASNNCRIECIGTNFNNGIELTSSSGTITSGLIEGSESIILKDGSSLSLRGLDSGNTINSTGNAIDISNNSHIDIYNGNYRSSGILIKASGSSTVHVSDADSLIGDTSAVESSGGSFVSLSNFTRLSGKLDIINSGTNKDHIFCDSSGTFNGEIAASKGEILLSKTSVNSVTVNNSGFIKLIDCPSVGTCDISNNGNLQIINCQTISDIALINNGNLNSRDCGTFGNLTLRGNSVVKISDSTTIGDINLSGSSEVYVSNCDSIGNLMISSGIVEIIDCSTINGLNLSGGFILLKNIESSLPSPTVSNCRLTIVDSTIGSIPTDSELTGVGSSPNVRLTLDNVIITDVEGDVDLENSNVLYRTYKNPQPLPIPVKGSTEDDPTSRSLYFPRVKAFDEIDGIADYELVKGQLVKVTSSNDNGKFLRVKDGELKSDHSDFDYAPGILLNPPPTSSESGRHPLLTRTSDAEGNVTYSTSYPDGTLAPDPSGTPDTSNEIETFIRVSGNGYNLIRGILLPVPKDGDNGKQLEIVVDNDSYTFNFVDVNP